MLCYCPAWSNPDQPRTWRLIDSLNVSSIRKLAIPNAPACRRQGMAIAELGFNEKPMNELMGDRKGN
jgi:hypothetical protein